MSKRPLYQKQEEDIVALYQQGIDAVKLASRYEISSTTVYNVLKRHGVQRRTNSDIFRKLRPEQEEAIIVSYQQGLPASTISSRYGIEDQTVYNILERHGVGRRSTSAAAIIYARNEHAFDVIDTEEAAYWLGFIAADGNVSNGRLRIGLSTRDADHIQKFARWLASDIPLYTSTNNLGRLVSTFDIGSKHLVEALGMYGIVPRKTYVMTHLPSVPHALTRHLLRGYIDADGHFSLRATGASFGVGSFNREMVEEIQNWFVEEIGVSRTSIICDSGHWRYRQYGSVQVKKIASYLYDNATVYLKRKYELVQRILALDNGVFHDHVCEYCGTAFQAPPQNDNARFCSNNCKTAHRYKSGVDDVTIACEQCGNEFTRNKYLKRRFCSKRCSARQQWAERKTQK